MRESGKRLYLIVGTVVAAVVCVWLVRQLGFSQLEYRTGPRTGVNFSVLDRGKLNINLADESELERLPGIGRKLATEIVRYRKTHGPFVYPEHLIAVPGMSRGLVEKLIDKIAV